VSPVDGHEGHESPADGLDGRGLVVTTPSDEQIVLTRRFAAPRRLVFAALTEPDLLRRWLGADGWHLVEAHVDLRVGGAWRFVSRGPGGQVMGHGGEYRVVDPPGRLVYTESYDDQWYPGEALVDAVLVDDHDRDGTREGTVLTTTLTYPSRQVRDHVARSPMERGVGEGYRRLDAVLAGLAGPNDRRNPEPHPGGDERWTGPWRS
jgi:uncharacterized protein YndB with AHSA1/START domain